MSNINTFDGQIAKAIYLKTMASMKEILNLGEFKIGDRESEDYKYFKREVMDTTYNNMLTLFIDMEKSGILQRCSCGATIRKGFKPCVKCAGCGHCNSEDFHDLIGDMKGRKIAEEMNKKAEDNFKKK